MKKIFYLFIFISSFSWAQMPNISSVWLNNSKAYTGTIGKNNQELKVKINISEQNKKNDQEYFVSGYTLVNLTYNKFEGKITIEKYKNSKKKGKVFGIYEFSEENKNSHSGSLEGKFVYTFKWNPKTEKIESSDMQFTGDWASYDGKLQFPTQWKNN